MSLYRYIYIYREYIQCKLLEELKVDKTYKLEFYFSYADNCDAFISNIGAFISNFKPESSDTNTLLYSVYPQMEYKNLIVDTINWIKFTGYFKALGSEEYLTIGNLNLNDNDLTKIILPEDINNPIIKNLAYIYIDDVSLVEYNITTPTVFTPNQDGFNETFIIPFLLPNSSLTIYNRWGNQVFTTPNYQNNWSAEGLSDGVYYYILTLPTGERLNGSVTVMR